MLTGIKLCSCCCTLLIGGIMFFVIALSLRWCCNHWPKHSNDNNHSLQLYFCLTVIPRETPRHTDAGRAAQASYICWHAWYYWESSAAGAWLSLQRGYEMVHQPSCTYIHHLWSLQTRRWYRAGKHVQTVEGIILLLKFVGIQSLNCFWTVIALHLFVTNAVCIPKNSASWIQCVFNVWQLPYVFKK